MTAQIKHGDCLAILAEMPDASIDTVVTDPPYGLAFMGKRWDYDVPAVEVWRECLRVLKPGGYMLAFAGTRTQHRMAVRIEDAGFEIRDMIAWVYGSGFPKSLDVSKAIDKAAGAKREVIGPNPNSRPNMVRVEASVLSPRVDAPLTAPATDAAIQWQGWGTALKPALEPITVARKPLDGTVAANVQAHGTGAINVDGCRVLLGEEPQRGKILKTQRLAKHTVTLPACEMPFYNDAGRWPANLIHDGSDEVVGLFPGDGDQSAARFFYCAKASKRDRDEGCDALPEVLTMRYGEKAQGPLPQQTPSKPVPQRNHHPTVKPTDLMRYLCRLVTPPGGVVLDPFCGSGSTGKAAVLESFNFIGIEREAEYVEIARARIAAAVTSRGLF